MDEPRPYTHFVARPHLVGACLVYVRAVTWVRENPKSRIENPKSGRAPSGRAADQPIRKLALTWKTALTIEYAMKPTKTNTPISTALAITLVNMLSWFEINF